VTEKSGNPIVLVRDVSKEFRRDKLTIPVLSGMNLQGKTTLLNAVAARSRPDAGSVEFLSREGELMDVHAMSQAQQRLLARTD